MQYLRFLLIIPFASGFLTMPLFPKHRLHTMHTIHTKMLSLPKNTTISPYNNSKVFKLDFDEDMEDPLDKLMKPRYRFGLSEFDMILIRMYVNMVVAIHFIRIYFEHLSQHK